MKMIIDNTTEISIKN